MPWKDRLGQRVSEVLDGTRKKVEQHGRGLKESATNFVHDPRTAEAAGKLRDLVQEGWDQAKHGRERLIRGTGAGAAGGIAVGALLGGGGVGIVALGGAVGVPLIALTGLAGAAVGAYVGRERDFAATLREHAAQRHQRAEEAQREHDGSRVVSVMDKAHLTALQEAIEDAEDTLCIRSAFLSDLVVNDRFIAQLRGLAARGVRVLIEHGFNPRKPDQADGYDRSAHSRAEDKLQALGQELQVGRHGGFFAVGPTWTHIKEISVDRKYVITGSYNWLSNAQASRSEKSLKIFDDRLAVAVQEETRAALGRAGSRLTNSRT